MGGQVDGGMGRSRGARLFAGSKPAMGLAGAIVWRLCLARTLRHPTARQAGLGTKAQFVASTRCARQGSGRVVQPAHLPPPGVHQLIQIDIIHPSLKGVDVTASCHQGIHILQASQRAEGVSEPPGRRRRQTAPAPRRPPTGRPTNLAGEDLLGGHHRLGLRPQRH